MSEGSTCKHRTYLSYFTGDRPSDFSSELKKNEIKESKGVYYILIYVYCHGIKRMQDFENIYCKSYGLRTFISCLLKDVGSYNQKS